MKILALDNLQKVGLDVFAKEGFEVDVKGKMTTEELSAVIDNYDRVVVRGATKATAMAFEKVSRLQQADASMKQGKWEKSKFMGTELTDKILGVVGLGNVGKVVVERALGLRMVVIGDEPYVSREDAGQLGGDVG